MMKTALDDTDDTVMKKHSVTIRGHRTSISMEHVFWTTFRSLAKRSGMTANEAVEAIDANRPEGVNLSSAIRCYVLRALLELSRR